VLLIVWSNLPLASSRNWSDIAASGPGGAAGGAAAVSGLEAAGVLTVAADGLAEAGLVCAAAGTVAAAAGAGLVVALPDASDFGVASAAPCAESG
jgi:hypothetical protein